MKTAIKKTQKTWGWSTRVYLDSGLQTEKIAIKSGGYSSIHLHEHKVNQFLVTTGELQVNLFNSDNVLFDCIRLKNNEKCSIDNNIRHQFVARSDVLGFEMYWPCEGGKVLPDDIIRFSENGLNEQVGYKYKTDRHLDTEYVWCCRCNTQCHMYDLYAVCIDNAWRDMCNECIRATGMEPINGRNSV